MDEGDAGNVKYLILSGNTDNTFKLDTNSGILYPGVSLLGRTGKYTIKIEARDGLGNGPNSDTTDAVIDVLEINQHRPLFIMPALSNATVEIQEVSFNKSFSSRILFIPIIIHQNLAEPHYLVMTVKANDSDSGDNGKVSYHLQVNNEKVQETAEFEINEISGELRLKKKLNRKKLARWAKLIFHEKF